MTGPQDPLGELGTMAVTLHEMFKSFMDAGFRRPEAFELVRTAVAESIRAGGQPKKGDG